MNNGRNDTPDVLTFPLNIWGKKGESIHLLEYHLIDVASVCHMYLEHDSRIRKILAESLGVPPSTAINLLRYLCSIHDIGKVCPNFQESVESIIKYRHDLGGYYIVTEHKDLFNQVTSTISLENNNRKIRRK